MFYQASALEDVTEALTYEIERLKEKFGKNLVIAIFSPADDNLSLIPANTITKAIILQPGKIAHVQMPDLIEWTRKRK